MYSSHTFSTCGDPVQRNTQTQYDKYDTKRRTRKPQRSQRTFLDRIRMRGVLQTRKAYSTSQPSLRPGLDKSESTQLLHRISRCPHQAPTNIDHLRWRSLGQLSRRCSLPSFGTACLSRSSRLPFSIRFSPTLTALFKLLAMPRSTSAPVFST